MLWASVHGFNQIGRPDQRLPLVIKLKYWHVVHNETPFMVFSIQKA